MRRTFTATAIAGRRRISASRIPTLDAAIHTAHALFADCRGATDLVVSTDVGLEAWRNGVLTPLGHELRREAEREGATLEATG